MEFPVDAAVSVPAVNDLGRAVKAWSIAVSLVYSLVLAAGSGFVFCASIRPVSIPTGDFAVFAAGPWEAAYLLLAVALAVGTVVLLALGIALRRHAGLTRWFVVGWLSALAAGVAIGLVTLHEFGLLFSAYPRDVDGTPLGPSRFDPGGPHWPALIAAGGELAVGAIMITLIAAPRRKGAPSVRAPRRYRSRMAGPQSIGDQT